MAKDLNIAIRLKLLADGVASGFRSIGDTVDGIGTKLKLVAAAVAGYFGIQAFAGAVRGAADLEAKLSEVQAVSNATAAEMDALRKAAEAAGATTKYTATEAAQALGNLARAGLTATQAIDALPATLLLAQAGSLELGQASEIVTKTVMGMGLAFTDAARVADVLAMGANASNTSVAGLADALSYAAPIATSLGLSLEQTVAIIGKFADAGIDASRAGTALNAILSQFGDPASKFRQELSQAGIITNDFGDALRQLGAKGAAGQKAILAVGTEAGPALRALLNQGIGALDELTAKLKTAQGSAAATAATMENNLNGALSTLSSAWDSVRIALATPVLPVLKQGVADLAKALQDAVASGTVQRFGDAIAKAFESSIAWGKEFAAQMDFKDIGERLDKFADRAGNAFRRFTESAREAFNVVSLVSGFVSGVANLFIAGIAKVEESFARAANNVLGVASLLLTGLSKITFGDVSKRFAQAAEELNIAARASWAASEALAKKASEAFNQFDQDAQQAERAWKGLASSQQSAVSTSNAATEAVTGTTGALQGLTKAAPDAGTAVSKAAEVQRVAMERSRAEAGEFRKAYEAAVAAGDWQAATENLQQFERALKGVTDSTRTAASETAAQVEGAFQRMGIKSSAELGSIASASERDFKIIRDSGTATTRDVAAAFKKYAEDAVASGDDVRIAQVAVEASMYDLEVATDATGKAFVRAKGSADGLGGSLDDVRNSAGDARTALERMNDELERQISAEEKSNELKQRAIALENVRRNTDANGFSKDMTGNQVINAEGATALSVINILKSYGLTDEQAKTIAAEFSDNNGGVRFGGQYGASSLSEALRRAAEKRLTETPMAKPDAATDAAQASGSVEATLQSLQSQLADAEKAAAAARDPRVIAAKAALAAAQAKVSATPTGSTSAAAATSTSHTVTINLNGKATEIGTASDSDSAALVALLTQLGQAATTAG